MHPVFEVIVLAWAALNLVLAFAARADPATASVFASAGFLTALGATSPGDAGVLGGGLTLSVCGPLLYGLRVRRSLTWWHHAARLALVAALATLYLAA